VIFILVALFCEAKPFIEQLSLKKNTKITEFPVYENEEVNLIISGTGKIKASVATAFLLKNKRNNSDFFINIGTCGAISQDIKPGEVVYPSKIIDHDTHREYYPEMLWKHNFIEVTLVTSSNAVKDRTEIININEWDFVDMESSGIFEAAPFFVPISSIIVLKIVSDYLTDINTGKITEKYIENIIRLKSLLIIDFIQKVKNFYGCEDNFNILSEEELSLLSVISEKLRFTITMSIDIKKHAVYLKKNNGDLINLLLPFLEKTVTSKFEAKKEFNLLKNVLSKQ